jgi:UDP-glucose:(heptosyl)LPS alpha-1,3-glucosyltransferase
MKIAFVVHDYHKLGGHSRYVAELAERFCRAHEVHVFTNRIRGQIPPGIQTHHVPAIRSSALASVLTFILPATFLVRGNFDIVHAQGLCGFRHNVVTAHICQQAWYREQQKHQGFLTWKQKLWRRLVLPLERVVFQRHCTSQVIAVSAKIAGDLRELYGRRGEIPVIFHGVDLETFHPRQRMRFRNEVRQQLGIAEKEFVMLYVGDLQKAAPAALRTVRHVPGKLVLVSRSQTAPYRNLADALGVSNRVLFCPFSDQIERYYAAADVFFFPTFYDSFGMVISEAMATGIPVVTNRAAGAAEIIENGKNGFVTGEAWDDQAYAAVLNHLASSPGLRDEVGRQARQTAEKHTWDAVAEATLRVYAQVLGWGK